MYVAGPCGIGGYEPFYPPKQTYVRLARAIHSLPYLPNRAFCLWRFEGLRYEQIAERMGISVRRVEKELGCAMGMIVRSRDRQERKGW
ncbi:sigma factor-like helix-turn-helix DNA-binding protein [Novosphingobium sp.]|uniref:sigma factor-like helix-turn-helix DNA-binding protein n=1 Tax=Novosphingobium sp. TaxID=1874826 RepID=UPI0025CDAA4A|nr:sigma factor-like helix-turn-helix DNA-binding protein [Novosphingobium sp.]